MKLPALILASDIGGTRIKLGVVCGRMLLAQIEFPANAPRGLAYALQRMKRHVPSLCRKAGVEKTALAGLGLSFPGIIEPHTERILSTPSGKFDDAKNLNVPKMIRDLFGLPVRICNDANAALLGEWRFGAARRFRSAVMLTLGTGIGSSVIIDGVPLRGQHGQAGNLGGHWTVNLHGRACICGNVGCAETEASTWTLPEQVRRHPGFGESLLAREKTLDYSALFRAAARRDPFAREFRRHALRVWSVTVVNLIHAYDPEAVIVGGGVMRSRKIILPALRRHVARHAWTPWGGVKILPAALGNYAGMIGVASLFNEQR